MLKKKRLFPLYSFLITLLLYFLIFACHGIFFGSSKTIMTGDLFAQYEGFIRMFLRVLKGEESMWYSFSIFLGSGTALTYAYYAFSPFNLLFLIPGISFPTMTLAVTALKHALAAYTFCLFLQKTMKRDGIDTVFFSLCYALCTFGVGMYLHIMWFDAVYTLPLVILSIDLLLRRKKCLPLILSYAYLFFTNFYMGFIFGVFSALAFLWLLIYRMDRIDRSSLKSAGLSILRYAFCGVLAAGLCAATLLPAALFLLSHSAADNFDFEPLKITLAELINSFMMGEMTSLDNDLPFTYCSLPVLLLTPFYFMTSGISKKEKYLTLGILLIYFFSFFYLPLYTAMHAFDYPNWYAFRFSYVIVFLLVSITCRVYPYLAQYSMRRALLWTGVLVFLYSVLIPIFSLRHRYFDVGNSQAHLMINLAFLLGWLLLLFLHRQYPDIRRCIAAFSAALLCAELCINGYLVLRNLDLDYVETDMHRNWSEDITTSLQRIEEKDSGFYRLHFNNDVISNSATIFGFNALSTFNSSDDYNLRKALSGLGIATTNRAIYDMGYYDISDMLFCAKYTVDLPEDLFTRDTEEAKDDPEDIPIRRFDYALPLGFMVSDMIGDYSAGSDPMRNQEELLRCMTGHEYHFFTPLSEEDISVTLNGAETEKHDDLVSFYRTHTLSDMAYILYSADITAEEEFYAAFPVDSPVSVINSPYLIGSAPGQLTNIFLSSGTLMRGIRNNGDFQEAADGKYGSVMICFKSETSNDYGARDTLFALYRSDELDDVYEELNSSAFRISSFKDSEIRGSVTVSEDRPVLFTSIPYDRDWHAEIDGTPVPTYTCVDDAFLSLRLTPGEHDIHLYYSPSGAKAGALISILSLAILILYTVWESRKSLTAKK